MKTHNEMSGDEYKEHKLCIGKYSVNDAVAMIHKHIGGDIDSLFDTIGNDIIERNLPTYEVGQLFVCKDKHKLHHYRYKEVLWSDLNHWIENKLYSVDFKFPEPSITSQDTKGWVKRSMELSDRYRRDNPGISNLEVAKLIRSFMVEQSQKGQTWMKGQNNKIPAVETIKRHGLRSKNK